MIATMELKRAKAASAMVLSAPTARELMTPNPVSVREDATVAETAVFLAKREVSAAPVIDEAGRPVGVISRSDLLRHRARAAVGAVESVEFFERLEHPGFSDAETIESGRSLVREVMTPVVFCVRPETPAATVVEKMVALEVRRLFVVDEDNLLVGVISAMDVLKKLRGLWA